MSKTILLFLIMSVALLISAPWAAAQYANKGELNTWTTKEVERDGVGRGATGMLKVVRAARQDGFDRVVLEFTEGLPGHAVSFTKPPFYLSPNETTRGPRVKIAGNSFIAVHLFSATGRDENNKNTTLNPQGSLDLPNILEVKRIYDWDSLVVYIIGLKARKPFRVQELANPARLVVDFQH